MILPPEEAKGGIRYIRKWVNDLRGFVLKTRVIPVAGWTETAAGLLPPSIAAAAAYEPPFTIKTRFHSGNWQVSTVQGIITAPVAAYSMNYAQPAALGWQNLADEETRVEVSGTWSHMIGPSFDCTGSSDYIYAITHHIASLAITAGPGGTNGYGSPNGDNQVEEIWEIGTVVIAAASLTDPAVTPTIYQTHTGPLHISGVVSYTDGTGTPPAISEFVNGSLLP